MLRNYFRIAWRHLTKNRTYTLINITGLATGMAIALLIGLWITDELSFDHYHKDHRRIAQALVIQHTAVNVDVGDAVSMPMGQVFRDQYRDLFARTALVYGDGDAHLIAAGDKKLAAPNVWAQKEFPEIFTFRMLKGSSAAIQDPSTALIAESLVSALFGTTDPIGKTVRYENKLDLIIGGVYEDLPQNTTYYGTKMVLPWGNKENGYHNMSTDWLDHIGQLYVQLAPGVTAEQATARIKNLPTSHVDGWLEEALIYPLDRTHLYNDFKEGKPAGGRIQFVWLFGIIGCFVLLLACINFMNLSTARSEKRAKEVGIRKTVGSLKRQLVLQFLSESIVVALLSFAVALLLTQLALPFFNSLAAKNMSLPWASGWFWLLALGFTLFTGLLAGSYPAFYLSHFDPIQVLKGSFRVGRYASVPRQVLVVLQFSVSLTLIIGTIIVYRQIQFAKDRPVGYQRERLLSVDINTPDLRAHYKALREELLQKGLVESIAGSSMKVTGFSYRNEVYWRGKRPDQESIFFRNVNVTPEFGATIGWHVLQGRDFSRDFAMDTATAGRSAAGSTPTELRGASSLSGSVIINQAGAKAMGFANPVGEIVKFDNQNWAVIGVVSDIVANSPYAKVEPAIFLGTGWMTSITMRLKTDRPVRAALDAMAPIFARYNPGSPFLYQFMDDEYARKFDEESRVGSLAAVFTGLAIFISCLGLFGLASFVAEQRTKEIGVRKVLGAGVFTLWGLLSKGFLKLIVLSFFISMPTGYLVMHKWLEGYPYRTPIAWWIFALAGAGTLLITLLTVSYQSLRAATMNPVKSLRTE